MIGRLTGKIQHKQPPELLIDVNGVGYEVFAPMSTFYQLPALEQTVTIHTHFVVREDAQLLYGFYTEHERRLFRALIRVNGVGPKLALTILSGMDTDVFVECVQSKNTSALIGIPGIGQKTAERLIIETRDVLAQWQHRELTPLNTNDTFDNNREIQDAISALITLGYKLADAKRAITQQAAPGLNSETLIRQALQHMMKGKIQ